MQANLLTTQIKLFWQSACKYWGLALAPLLLLTAVAAAYALMREPTWKASQGLIVRDQASERSNRGRFESLDAMKTAQETILEIARNPKLIQRSLRDVGPPSNRKEQGAWPTQAEINDTLDGIAVSAPKGAEFGSTEMIYLNVVSSQKLRALRLNEAVCNQLESRLQEIRENRAHSIIAELEKSLSLSEAELEKSTKKLEDMEREVGRDLGELRMLNTQGSGESNLRSAIGQIKNELRQSEALLEEQQQQLAFLRSAIDDPTRLLGAPSRLLDTQPALRRLKDGLVDAQLRTAQLSGTRSPDHPLMKAARIGEAEVRRDLHRELHSAEQGISAAIDVTTKQQGLLKFQLQDVTNRMSRLAGLRARYGNLVANVKHRTSIVAENNRLIAEAKANQQAAKTSSLLTRIDSPVIGDKPEGPGKTTIVLGGVAGGLFAGFGLLLLVTPISSPNGESWSTAIIGRRREDQSASGRGRRGSDQTPATRRSSDAARQNPPQIAPQDPPARRGDDTPADAASNRRESDPGQQADQTPADSLPSANGRQISNAANPPAPRKQTPEPRDDDERREQERRGGDRRQKTRRD